VDTSITKVKVGPLIDDAIVIMPRKVGKDGKESDKKTLLDEMKGKVSGDINMNSKFNGTTYNDVPHTIKGSGAFTVNGGKLISLDMAKKLSAQFGLKFLQDDIEFDVLGSDFTMAGGKINIRNFRLLKGPNGKEGKIKARGEGYVTVNDELDMKIETDLSPGAGKEIEDSIAKNFKLTDASYAYNTDGWLPLDFRVYGTVQEKKYDYNQDRMMENVKRNLTKKVEDQGKKVIEEKAKEWINGLMGK
jgi:hypothetical protein